MSAILALSTLLVTSVCCFYDLFIFELKQIMKIFRRHNEAVMSRWIQIKTTQSTLDVDKFTPRIILAWLPELPNMERLVCLLTSLFNQWFGYTSVPSIELQQNLKVSVLETQPRPKRRATR
uniref:uncharacterized protein LOC100178504 isoform X2 n=1 Tax=Ciona intestinalis TaxID=7719 RepID=UPI000EF44673|nr:uncharacterized protein LOC100178504 isoform X2 [Ciona intestinalis]|eukprot:XP_026692346.1 uncharacterized protein LOC100178504 isoform X2 [Ciona intestinalis]